MDKTERQKHSAVTCPNNLKCPNGTTENALYLFYKLHKKTEICFCTLSTSLKSQGFFIPEWEFFVC